MCKDLSALYVRATNAEMYSFLSIGSSTPQNLSVKSFVSTPVPTRAVYSVKKQRSAENSKANIVPTWILHLKETSASSLFGSLRPAELKRQVNFSPCNMFEFEIATTKITFALTCDRMDISLCCRKKPMLVFKTVVLSIFRLFGLTFIHLFKIKKYIAMRIWFFSFLIFHIALRYQLLKILNLCSTYHRS